MKNIFINMLAFNIILSSILTITALNPVISVIYLIVTFFNAAGYLIITDITFIGISYLIIYVGAIAVLFLFVIMMINIKLTDISETGNQFTKNIPLALAIGVLFVFLIQSIIPFNQFNESPINVFLSILTNLSLYLMLFISISPTNLSTNISTLDANPLDIAFYIDNFTSLYQGHIFNKPLLFLPFNNGDSTPETIITEFGQIEVLGHGLYTYGGVLLILLSAILLLAMVSSIFISRPRNI